MSAIFYPDIIDLLKNYEQKGSKYGLERTRALLNLFGSPDKKLKIVHIAGSNGKGSTAAFITNILIAAGYRVGTFTSPEVYSFSEQFAFNGRGEEEFIKYYLSEVYSSSLEMEDKPTAFEIMTVAALAAFAASGCEYAVIECGLGGKDDSTNAISQKSVAVITSVSLEHTAILGKTIEQICQAKAGIIDNCPAVISALQLPGGRQYFSRFTKEFAGDGLEITSRTQEGQTFRYKGGEYCIRMSGDAQCYNAAVAIEVARLLGVGGCQINAGLVLTKSSGRCERLQKGEVSYILDGAHNPAAFSPLLDIVNRADGKKSLVFGCLSDKDVQGAAEILSPAFDEILIFQPKSYRAMDADKIYSAFAKADAAKKIIKVDSASEGLQRASGKVVSICGTFTCLKEAKEWIERGQ